MPNPKKKTDEEIREAEFHKFLMGLAENKDDEFTFEKHKDMNVISVFLGNERIYIKEDGTWFLN